MLRTPLADGRLFAGTKPAALKTGKQGESGGTAHALASECRGAYLPAAFGFGNPVIPVPLYRKAPLLATDPALQTAFLDRLSTAADNGTFALPVRPAPQKTAGTAHYATAVVGLGYVGLPLCLAFSKAGVRVLGIDTDRSKTEKLLAGQSYIKHITRADVAAAVQERRFHATTDFSECARADAILICVPTPLTVNRTPDLSYVVDTARSLAAHIRKGHLVVLESTTYPGTTEEVVKPILEQGSGLVAGVDFHLAFSPEREDPGNPRSNFAEVPKVVGGLTPECLARATQLYKHIVKEVVPVSSCGVAEATKLTENIFRSVNIALVNELKLIYSQMGIDVWEVINAAATKPFGYMPFYPGPGLGGHCIPIDPFYLTWKALEYGQRTRLIELAGEINTAMPDYVVSRVIDALNDAGKRFVARGCCSSALPTRQTSTTTASRPPTRSCSCSKSARRRCRTTTRMFP